jgi:hypothetical protein
VVSLTAAAVSAEPGVVKAAKGVEIDTENGRQCTGTYVKYALHLLVFSSYYCSITIFLLTVIHFHINMMRIA